MTEGECFNEKIEQELQAVKLAVDTLRTDVHLLQDSEARSGTGRSLVRNRMTSKQMKGKLVCCDESRYDKSSRSSFSSFCHSEQSRRCPRPPKHPKNKTALTRQGVQRRLPTDRKRKNLRVLKDLLLAAEQAKLQAMAFRIAPISLRTAQHTSEAGKEVRMQCIGDLVAEVSRLSRLASNSLTENRESRKYIKSLEAFIEHLVADNRLLRRRSRIQTQALKKHLQACDHVMHSPTSDS